MEIYGIRKEEEIDELEIKGMEILDSLPPLRNELIDREKQIRVMEHEITKYLARKKEKAANYEKKIKDLKREID